MLQNKIRRIAVIGPESTGKTTLCQELALHYHTVWVPEYARLFMENLNRVYTLNDIEYIARKQLEEEEAYLKLANRFLFSDTDLIIAKVWCEDVFHQYPSWMNDFINLSPYDLYLIMKPDIPWVSDPIRENETRRDYFFELYKKEVRNTGRPFEIIGGDGIERFRQAVKSIDRHF